MGKTGEALSRNVLSDFFVKFFVRIFIKFFVKIFAPWAVRAITL